MDGFDCGKDVRFGFGGGFGLRSFPGGSGGIDFDAFLGPNEGLAPLFVLVLGGGSFGFRFLLGGTGGPGFGIRFSSRVVNSATSKNECGTLEQSIKHHFETNLLVIALKSCQVLRCPP